MGGSGEAGGGAGASTGSKTGAGDGSASQDGTRGVFGLAPLNDEEVPMIIFCFDRSFAVPQPQPEAWGFQSDSQVFLTILDAGPAPLHP